MYKSLYFISLLVLIFSCSASTKTITSHKTNVVPKSIMKEIVSEKPKINKENKLDFFTKNIGDTLKRNFTISHGSIVSAKPKGYKINKDHFPALSQNFRQKYLILHYTVINEEKSIKVLTQESVSSHYLVNDKDDKEIYQLVDENKRAYHSGISAWRKDKNLNDISIGIEIVNPGFIIDSLGNRVFYPYSEHQFKKIAALVKDIVDRYHILPEHVLGHSDVAPLRKQDPGPLFPWKRLYTEYGVGMWYDENTLQKYKNNIIQETFTKEMNSKAFITKVQEKLQQLGYEITPSGSWNKENMKVVEAFQFHFRPEKYDGLVDAETWAILQSLVEKYP